MSYTVLGSLVYMFIFGYGNVKWFALARKISSGISFAKLPKPEAGL